MEGILVGFMIGLMVGAVLILVWLFIESACSKKSSKYSAYLFVVITLLSWIVTTLCWIDSDKTGCKAWTQKYISQKQLIEESLVNEKLSGLERVELVKQANELNGDLIEAQFNCVKWYNFTMDDKVLELEPVSLK